MRLNGNPEATLAEARSLLQRARDEARGQPRGHRTRQAAEKLWLAASTAADAMTGPVESAREVFSAFSRAWGAEGSEVAKDIESSLHRGCFYSNAAACDGDYVLKFATRLGRIFHRPIRDSGIRRRLAQT